MSGEHLERDDGSLMPVGFHLPTPRGSRYDQRPTLTCVGCLKEPAEIEGYANAMLEDPETGERLYASADDYVWREEGTLNRRNGHFLCDMCYIAWGSPSSVGGWKAP